MNRGIILSLNIIIHLSAFMCSIKCKNRILYFIFECIYCIMIFALPVLFLSILLTALCGNENTDIFDVIFCMGYLFGGGGIYFIIVNWKNQIAIEDYMLSGALYVKQYITHKQRIKKQKINLVLELMHIMILYTFLSFGIVFLLVKLFVESYTVILIGSVVALIFTYILFVYGNRDEDTTKKRKTLVGSLITLVWLVIVCIRINQYWTDITQVGVEDMLILFFSAIFTIPTIHDWLKNIPTRLIEPYVEIVGRQKIELIDKYIYIEEESKKEGFIFFKEIKEVGNTIRTVWKEIEKKKKIKFFLQVLCVVLLMGMLFWGINMISVFLQEASGKIKIWYGNLNVGVQEITSRILITVFFVGTMIYGLVNAPKVYKSKLSVIEKMKYIGSLLLFEVVFGAGVLMVWGFFITNV